MRTIKFRVWDGERMDPDLSMLNDETGMVDTVVGISLCGGYLLGPVNDEFGSIEIPEGWEVMQWTGLYDATKWEDLSAEERAAFAATLTNYGVPPIPSLEWPGREIYEGDWLELTEENTMGGPRRGYVNFHGGGFRISTSESYANEDGYDESGEVSALWWLTDGAPGHIGHDKVKARVVGNIYELQPV